MPAPPFGLWDSPLQARDLAHSKRLKDVAWDADGHTLVWLEGRGDCGVLVCQSLDQAPRELNTTLSVQARVGYGGGDFTVARGQVYFVERHGRLYRQSLQTGPALPITPAFGQAAAPRVSKNGRWVVYVHSDAGVDQLAIVDTTGDFWPQRLVWGADFYMQPAWHPKGRMLAWIEWDHPRMPWDGSRLVLGQLSSSPHHLPRMRGSTVLAGDADTALFQPEFSPDGRYLAYVSDQRGWSNLWLYNLESGAHTCLTEDSFDIAPPAWVQGLRACSFSADSRHLYFTRSEGGARRAWHCELENRAIHPVEALTDYLLVEQLAAAPRGRALACIASSPQVSARILSCAGPRVQIHARATSEAIPAAVLARPEPVSWPSGTESQVHGIYYPPAPPAGEVRGRPPVLVMVHGGPTGQADLGYSDRNQFFATRGYAVLDVNYRGSTGYGRDYQKALHRNWGIYDVEDSVSGARHLVDTGRADPARLVIMGGSAGGYTVLRTLTEKPGFFKAGICLYGISNLFTLAADTHKFEAHYLDSLLGPLPEASAAYRERSPIFAVEKLRDPVAIFQGTEDKVVPPEQAEAIAESLRHRQVPHEYRVFEGEGHGWRRPETIAAFYQAVEAFLKKYVLFG